MAIQVGYGYLFEKKKIDYENGVQTAYELTDVVVGLYFQNTSSRRMLHVLTGYASNRTISDIEDEVDADQMVFIGANLENQIAQNDGHVDFQTIRKKQLENKSRWYYKARSSGVSVITDQNLTRLLDTKYPISNRSLNLQESNYNAHETVLSKYGICLTDEEYETNPAVGRQEELHQLILGLLSQEKSVALVGPPGVGKTAIVEGLAYAIHHNQVPKLLQNYEIYKIDTSSLVSGTRYRGDFEERVETVLKELGTRPNTILFIDEFHTIIGAGSASSSSLDLANILKPYLDRGKIKMIGATTVDEYEHYIKSDPALKRRFKKINVEEPVSEVMYEILDEYLKKLTLKTKLKVPFNEDEKSLVYSSLLRLTEKSHRVYDDPLCNPDLALSIVDTAFACAAAEDKEQVEVDHFIEAIQLENRIYKSARVMVTNQLLDDYEDLKMSQGSEVALPPHCKIIKFPG